MTGLVTRLSQHKKKFIIAAGVVIAIVIVSIFLNANKLRNSIVGMIDTSTYQAVHLDTGETYFGKIIKAKDCFITITDVFYFLDDSKQKLVKRDKEVNSSSASLTINHSHILTTENLSKDSPIMKAILKYYKNKN